MKRMFFICLVFALAGCGVDVQETERLVSPEMPRFDQPDLAAGRSVWMGTCRNCHLMGISGAPAVTNYAAWEERIAKGYEALYGSALNGIKGVAGETLMPPRGGNDRLTDDQVKRAVDYMVASALHFNRS